MGSTTRAVISKDTSNRGLKCRTGNYGLFYPLGNRRYIFSGHSTRLVRFSRLMSVISELTADTLLAGAKLRLRNLL